MRFGSGAGVTIRLLFVLGRPVPARRCCRALLIWSLFCSLMCGHGLTASPDLLPDLPSASLTPGPRAWPAPCCRRPASPPAEFHHLMSGWLGGGKTGMWVLIPPHELLPILRDFSVSSLPPLLSIFLLDRPPCRCQVPVPDTERTASQSVEPFSQLQEATSLQ